MPEPVVPPIPRTRRRRGRCRRKAVRRTARVAALSAAATVLVLIAGLAAWRSYSEWRLGRVELTNDGPPLTVQVLDESGEEPIGEPVEVFKKSTLALPDGDYRLRVNEDGRLGRTFRLAVNRGETIAHRLSLDEGRLLGRDPDPSWSMGQDRPREEPMPFALVTTALELTPGKSDIVEFTGRTVIRRDGATGKAVWDAANPTSPHDPGRDPARWLGRIGPNRWGFAIADPAGDLDGDGTRDVLVVVGNNHAFLALSGKDGSMLWNHVAEHDGTGGPQPEGPDLPGPVRPANRQGSIIGRPAIGDVDGDGTPDLIATLVFQEFPTEAARRTGKPPNMTPILSRRVVQAISGRSGRGLWSYPIDPAFATIKTQYWDKPAVLTRGRRSSAVAIVAGSRRLALYPATGRTKAGPIDLGLEPVRPLQYADLDGDGEPEIVALGPGTAPKQQSLTAFSSATGRPLWTATVAASYEYSPHNGGMPAKGWPWLVDLDGDGLTEVIVPDSGPTPPKGGFRGVKVLDGPSGRTRWARPMSPETAADDGLDHLLDAPDLDGDGVRELIAVSRFEGRNPPASRMEKRSEPERAYVDAISGRDGRLLWSWHADLTEGKYAYIWAPRWWGRGPDGWPLLAVPLGGQNVDQPGGMGHAASFHPAAVHVLEASTGHERNRVVALGRIGVADLDGDGLTDLWGEAEGQLRAFRGEPPEVWRALGAFTPARKTQNPWNSSGRPAADLDGDGIADTLSDGLHRPRDSASDPRGSRTAVARSGRDGRMLWKTVLDPARFWSGSEPGRGYNLASYPPPAGDLDGDGTPDVIAEKFSNDPDAIGRELAALPIQALSGRDGRSLWSAGRLGFEAHGHTRVEWFEPRIFRPGDPPDLLVLHGSPFVQPAASAVPTPPSPWAPTRQRLARVSGRTGRVLWDVPLEDQPSRPEPGWPVPPKVADLDGDGNPDAALVVRRASRGDRSEFELKSLSLRDGASLWSRTLQYQGFISEFPSCEIGQGGTGEPATVYVTELPSTPDSNELFVHALEGRDGSIRWTWRSGVGEGDRKVYGGIDPINLDGKGKDSVCITYSEIQRESHILILDPRGRELTRRVIPPEPFPTQYFPPVGDAMLDLDGDGRDELMVWYAGRLSAWGRDLKEIWSRPAGNWETGQPLPASPGRPRTLIVDPMTGLDGSTGRVLWTYKAPRWEGATLLDPGDPGRMPRVVSARSGPTVCRQVLPATPGGDYEPPSGARVPSGLVPDDPRWTRPLPWTGPVGRVIAPSWILAVVGLALVNVALPIAMLRLAARRRPWTIRLLMALPVAAAVPLSAYLAVEPLMPAKIDPLPPYPKLLFALATIAGIPVVTLAALAGWSLLRLRWRPLALLAGLTLLASAAIAAAWLRADMRAMPTIEHYGRSGWYLVLVPGAYAAGLLILIAWPLRRVYRWLRRPREPAAGMP